QESAPSNKIKAAPLDATAPFPPREVKAVEEENLISIVWDVNMEPDLDHYDIFRATGMNLEYTKLNKKPIPADAPRWSDENVMSGPTYYYKVKAYDKSGNESAFSAPAFGKPVDKTPPGKPKNLTFKLENHEIVLQWKPPQDPDLRGYYIYRAGPYAKLMRIVGRPVGKDTLFYTDAGMTGRGLWPGQTYEYAVASVDWAENIGEKAVIKVTVPDDEAPQKPTAMWARTTMEGEVRVSWQPSLSLDIAGYRIFRGPAGESAALKPITTVPDSVRKYNDKNVEKGVRYAYQVAAVDAAGNESEKTDSVEVTPQDAVAPPEPENVKAVVRDGKVVLTWTAVDAADLKGYNIYKSDQPSGQYKRINSAAVDKTQFVDNNGQAGAYYRVTSEDTSGKERKNVRAVKAEGES
ncbi:hypothetical protein JW935_16385, partial [candidate division KSB1 bacterium]|nr:hypothetical protein [candidate division KSB1 bacterium]